MTFWWFFGGRAWLANWGAESSRLQKALRQNIYWYISCYYINTWGLRTSYGNYHFYRAMLCIRGTSHGLVSVCLSVTSRCSTNQIILFVTCYISSRAESLPDRYVGIDLKQFVRQLRLNDDETMIVLGADDVICKCVTVQDLNAQSYALQLTQFL